MPVAYTGAVFCGAACSARWEAGDRQPPPPPPSDARSQEQTVRALVVRLRDAASHVSANPLYEEAAVALERLLERVAELEAAKDEHADEAEAASHEEGCKCGSFGHV